MKYLIIFLSIAFLSSCQNEPQVQWNWERTINLKSISPNGIIVQNENLILANPANNSLDIIDFDGILKKRIATFNRPMHISIKNETIYVADFLSDSILTWNNNSLGHMDLPDTPDAPSAVSVMDGAIAVADFYNNRIIYSRNGENKTFGQEGMLAGDLNYPTDVQFAHNKIYVADAYNHRINVYDLDGAFQFSFGKEEKMNAAVGIYVSDMHAFVCDYENSKVNIYDLNGKFQTSIDKDLSKPSDTYFHNDKLYVANYEGKSISVFSMK